MKGVAGRDLDPFEARRRERASQALGGEVGPVARKLEREPVVAERSPLPRAPVGHDHRQPASGPSAACTPATDRVADRARARANGGRPPRRAIRCARLGGFQRSVEDLRAPGAGDRRRLAARARRRPRSIRRAIQDAARSPRPQPTSSRVRAVADGEIGERKAAIASPLHQRHRRRQRRRGAPRTVRSARVERSEFLARERERRPRATRQAVVDRPGPRDRRASGRGRRPTAPARAALRRPGSALVSATHAYACAGARETPDRRPASRARRPSAR